jgi:hypothetical protein
MKNLSNAGKAKQDPTDQNKFNIFQDIAGAGTLPTNPAMGLAQEQDGLNTDLAQPLSVQENAQTNTALQTTTGSTTQIDPGTGAAVTLQTIQNS